jgi:hypothetical protein
VCAVIIQQLRSASRDDVSRMRGSPKSVTVLILMTSICEKQIASPISYLVRDAFPMSVPIFEPELSFLPFSCECGARVATQADLDLHKREICLRRFDRNYKQPSIFSGMLPGTGGVADGGRRM